MQVLYVIKDSTPMTYLHGVLYSMIHAQSLVSDTKSVIHSNYKVFIQMAPSGTRIFEQFVVELMYEKKVRHT